MGRKVFVGLSGGVDSAVAAALLQRQGHAVTGVFIRISIEGYPCTAGEDRIEAMRVAAHLRIPFLEVDFSKEYKEEVFRSAVAEFSWGRTPNPDALCNQKIKFGHFWEYARAKGAEAIATGHYAQIRDGLLYKGRDIEKDQSYFLWMVPEPTLSRTLFPVGHLHKREVRARAKRLGLPNAERKDSQGLCFLGAVSLEDMLRRELPLRRGAVLDEAGTVIGSHEGAPRYTLGQRHGFTVNIRGPRSEAHFVIGKDLASNTITVSAAKEPAGAETHLALADTNWIGEVMPGIYEARFRYRGSLIRAALVDQTTVVLSQPHYVSEGQSLVLYDGERCLGGGVVDKCTVR